MNLEDEQATTALARRLPRSVRRGDVVTFSGPLGVGKTALARGFIAGLGHEGEVPSPTFAIVQPTTSSNRLSGMPTSIASRTRPR